MTDSEYLYFSDCYSAMLFSKQLHWISIIFNSINWVKSRTRRIQTSETSNIHARVESCLFIVSSRLTCSISSLPVFKSQPLGRLDTTNTHASTQAWTFEISDACIHRFRDSTQSILLKMIVCRINFSAIACWKAWHEYQLAVSLSHRKNVILTASWTIGEMYVNTMPLKLISWLIHTFITFVVIMIYMQELFSGTAYSIKSENHFGNISNQYFFRLHFYENFS